MPLCPPFCCCCCCCCFTWSDRLRWFNGEDERGDWNGSVKEDAAVPAASAPPEPYPQAFLTKRMEEVLELIS